MDPVQPRFQVCEDEMDDSQYLLGACRSPRSDDGEVFVAALSAGWRSRSIVGDERRARTTAHSTRTASRLRARPARWRAEPRRHSHPSACRACARRALANLHSTGDRFIVGRHGLAARPAASPGFIDLTCSPGLPPIRS